MATMHERLRAVELERTRRMAGGGDKEIERQHQKGKLTARERVGRLLDPGSFQEIDLWSDAYKTGQLIDEVDLPGDALVAGWGEVKGRPLYVWAQDATLMGGTMAEIHMAKIVRVMEKALTERVPIVGIHDSEGVRIESALTAHAHCTFGTMMRFQTISSGVIPQIALVMGPCIGGAALSAALSDFLFMVKDSSYMHVAPPPPGSSGAEYGGARMHSRSSGCCDFMANSDDDCLKQCRELLSLLPLRNGDRPPIADTGDPPDRAEEELMNIVPEQSFKCFDMREIVKLVADNGHYLELKKDYASNLSTGFVRFAGRPTGVIANNSIHKAGCEDVQSSDKHSRFTRFCDAFNIPIVYFADCPGFLPGVDQERMAILRHGTMVIHSTCEATVPRISVFVRKVYGGAQLAMPSNYVKVDRMLAWPTVERGTMGAEGLAAVMYKGRLDRAGNPDEKKAIWSEAVAKMEQAVGRFSSVANEDYIDPRQTRQLVIKSLKCTENKSQHRPARKHENINL